MPNKTKCYCCSVEDATRKDYRERDGVLSKYAVCDECAHKSDQQFFADRDKAREVTDSGKWFCPDCYSTNISLRLWVNVNEGVINDVISNDITEMDESSMDFECDDCGNSTRILRSRKEVECHG